MRIGKKDIYQKRKSEIECHQNSDAHKVALSKYSQEEYIKSYNREKFEYRKRITQFKNREEIHKSSRDSISESSSSIDSICGFFLSFCYKRDESSFCHWCYEHIKKNPYGKCYENLPEVRCMNPLDDNSKKLIFEFKDIDVRKSELVQDNTTEIDCRE